MIVVLWTVNNCRISIGEEPDARCINITGDAKAITRMLDILKRVHCIRTCKLFM